VCKYLQSVMCLVGRAHAYAAVVALCCDCTHTQPLHHTHRQMQELATCSHSCVGAHLCRLCLSATLSSRRTACWCCQRLLTWRMPARWDPSWHLGWRSWGWVTRLSHGWSDLVHVGRLILAGQIMGRPAQVGCDVFAILSRVTHCKAR